jgi:trehalose/maltose hydrolase-like predicted phosphorylase
VRDATLVYEGYQPAEEGLREALTSTGNGYFCARGTAEWEDADGEHYPGTYCHGGYNRETTVMSGRAVLNEDLVNLPNWLVLKLRIEGDDVIRLAGVDILEYRHVYDIRTATVMRSVAGEEISTWRAMSRRMFVPFHDDGVISQFEGYEDLEELDWDACRRRYPDIQRLDRILRSEGDDPDRYKLTKQADTVMLFFLFPEEELRALFERLGYELSPDAVDRTIDYYDRRTSHGSTLSFVAHAAVLAHRDPEGSWQRFLVALESDVGDVLHFDPGLRDRLNGLSFPMRFRGIPIRVTLTEGELTVAAAEGEGDRSIRVGVGDDVRELRAGGRHTFALSPRAATPL